MHVEIKQVIFKRNILYTTDSSWYTAPRNKYIKKKVFPSHTKFTEIKKKNGFSCMLY